MRSSQPFPTRNADGRVMTTDIIQTDDRRGGLDPEAAARRPLLLVDCSLVGDRTSGPSRIEREPQNPPQSPRIPRRGAIDHPWMDVKGQAEKLSNFNADEY